MPKFFRLPTDGPMVEVVRYVVGKALDWSERRIRPNYIS
jgi:hypothetical protein